MSWYHHALLPYRLRTVAIGVRLTVLALAAMTAFALVPGHGHLERGPFGVIVVLAAAGVLFIARLPWERLLTGRLGVPVLYAWSIGDILLIGVGQEFAGRGNSSVFLIYMLTTLFFAATYPPRGQGLLLAFTLVSYTAFVLVFGWDVGLAVLLFRLAAISLVALMARFISDELLQELIGHRTAREESESRAASLAVVASAARSMSAIDPDRVAGIVVDAAIELGFAASEVCLFDADEDEPVWEVSHRSGARQLAEAPDRDVTELGRLIHERRTTVVIDDYSAWEGGVPGLQAAGFRATVASPVWSQGDLVGALISARLDGRGLLPYEIECHELLAAQAGAGLDTYRLFEARAEFEQQLSHQAFHDPLTGLPNRALFADRLQQTLARSRRVASTAGVLFIDLDRFKTVNDSLGHEVGDRLLAAVAGRLHGCLRPGDTLARHGGDEFTVLLEQITGENEASAVAERLLAALQQPFALGDHEVFMAGSIGIAVSSPGEDDEDLLRQADLAMYRAKERGRGRWELFHHDMAARARERLQWETELRQAIEDGQFRLLYQPIVSLASGRVEQVEALIRWDHPERGTVSPVDFVPLAEETGLVVPMGRWVLDEACRQLADWRAEGVVPSVAVNLSVRQLDDRGLVDDVADVLRRTGLDPSALTLEITESAVMEEVDATVRLLNELAALGVRFALDDFGQGYSSLGYLQRFPLHTVKIDKAFVQGLASGRGDRAIVRSVVTLATDLGLGVTAEGVETEEQLAQVTELGCANAQGFFFSRPVTAEAARLLCRQAWPVAPAAVTPT